MQPPVERLTRNAAGSGGFKLRRYDPAIGFHADRFEEHFAGFGKSNITSMEFRVVLETASRALGLQKGEFNTTDGYLPQDQIKRLRKSLSDGGWFELETEDGTAQVRLDAVVYVRVEGDEHRVGFG